MISSARRAAEVVDVRTQPEAAEFRSAVAYMVRAGELYGPRRLSNALRRGLLAPEARAWASYLRGRAAGRPWYMAPQALTLNAGDNVAPVAECLALAPRARPTVAARSSKPALRAAARGGKGRPSCSGTI